MRILSPSDILKSATSSFFPLRRCLLCCVQQAGPGWLPHQVGTLDYPELAAIVEVVPMVAVGAAVAFQPDLLGVEGVA